MAVDENLFSTISEIINWSRNKAVINRVWIYGSRLKGTQKNGSDLDVAIEIDKVNSESEMLSFWMNEKLIWLKELQTFSPFQIHLEMYGTPNVNDFIASCSMLVYERKIL